jgi:hypothetical protein
MSNAEVRRNEKALKLTKQLIELGGDIGLLRRVENIQRRLTVPMADVIAKLPGKSHSSNCRMLGVSRSSYYDWLSGESRPSRAMAKKLSKITGFSVGEIRGLSDDVA